jgi:hypothetical protein
LGFLQSIEISQHCETQVATESRIEKIITAGEDTYTRMYILMRDLILRASLIGTDPAHNRINEGGSYSALINMVVDVRALHINEGGRYSVLIARITVRMCFISMRVEVVRCSLIW